MTPSPPPGFDLVNDAPSPPPGFDLVDDRLEQLRRPGVAERVLRGVPVIGGALDEIGAGADAALNYVSGGQYGAPYGQSLDERRLAIEKSDTEHPIRNTLEMVAGGGVAARALPFFQPFGGARPGLMSAASNGAVNAAALTAPTAFLNGEGGFDARLDTAKDATGLAAAVGAGFGAVGQRVAARLAGTRPNSVARDAQAAGVDIPTFMDGGRPSQQIASKLGAIPYVGDNINASVVTARNQTADAANRIGQQVSGGATARQAGESVSQALSLWSDDGARAVQDRVYGAVNNAMNGRAADLVATRTAVTELARQQNVAASPIHQRAIREVEEAITRPDGLNFEGITRLRTRIGTMIDNQLDPENRTSRAGLQAIYGALTRDMEGAIGRHGGPNVQRAWRRANAVTRRIAERRDAITRVIGNSGEKSGESIVDRILTLASTKSSADAQRLTMVRRAVRAPEWEQLSGAAIQRLGRNQSNEFSADIFLKNYTQMSDEGRRIIFGSTQYHDLVQALNALANVSRSLQQFNRLGNPSGTGGVTALVAALGGAASGDMGATLGTALGGRGIGYLMSRPAIVRNVTQHSQNVARFIAGQGTQAAINASAAILANAVAKETREDRDAVRARILSVSRPKDLGA